MNKLQIIDAIRVLYVAEGERLVKHTVPDVGYIPVRLGCGPQIGGVGEIIARVFCDGLVRSTSEMPEMPNASFFEHLHNESLDYHLTTQGLESSSELKADLVFVHRRIVDYLRTVSREIGISYKEPDDSLLALCD